MHHQRLHPTGRGKPNPLHHRVRSRRQQGGSVMIEPSRSWRSIDLGPILSGQWVPPQPAVGARRDGIGLFYPRKMHTVASESEAGKTWLVISAAYHELQQGNSVLYIDF